jgi:predicted glycosyl hydrolase (DUF1957 family)
MNESIKKDTNTWWKVAIDCSDAALVTPVEVLKETPKCLVIREPSSWNVRGFSESRVNKESESAIYFNSELEAHSYSLRRNKLQRDRHTSLLDRLDELITNSTSFISSNQRN